MRHPDLRHATTARAWGLRRVQRITWGLAGAGAAGAIFLAVGFGARAHTAQSSQQAPGGQAPAGQVTGGGAGAQAPGSQLQPPQGGLGSGFGAPQVISGGS